MTQRYRCCLGRQYGAVRAEYITMLHSHNHPILKVSAFRLTKRSNLCP